MRMTGMGSGSGLRWLDRSDIFFTSIRIYGHYLLGRYFTLRGYQSTPESRANLGIHIYTDMYTCTIRSINTVHGQDGYYFLSTMIIRHGDTQKRLWSMILHPFGNCSYLFMRESDLEG